MYSPEIVLGYLMGFDISQDAVSARYGATWCQVLRQRLTELSGRRVPSWSVGMIEGFAIVEVDFSKSSTVVRGEKEVLRMLDKLVAEVRRRNPSLLPEGTTRQ
jgi:hypothetical protein